jgi:hypothetical protein
MRYLFGDSTPFPLTFDFLATLDAFVACAGQVVRLESESNAQERRVSDDAELRTRTVEGVDRFHQTVLRAMRETSMKSLDTEVIDYATDITDHATRYVEGMRQAAASKTEREVAQLNVALQRRREEARMALQQFFVAATLPVLESHFSMNLHGIALKDAYHEISVTETHPLGITCALDLDASAVAEWRHPRKVSDFVPGLELLVGGKRSWFNKNVQRDLLRLDEFVVAGFELDDESAQIRLRKKLEQKEDSLVFQLRRMDSELFAEARHPDDEELDQVLPAHVEPHERAHLERFWQMLRRSVSSVSGYRQRLRVLHLDLVDVFDADRAGDLVERIVQMLAPTAQEVAKRSPNAHELSLKEEGDDGRRREIYLRKDDLVRKLEPLTPEDRLRFAPLALFAAPSGEAGARLDAAPARIEPE